MKFTVLVIVLSLYSSLCSAVSPIPGDVLYKSPDSRSITLSPDGEYVLSYEIENEIKYLVLFNPVKGTGYKILNLGNNDQFDIKEIVWTDDQTVYLDMGSNSAFVDITFLDEKPTAKFKKITGSGYLVAPLQAEEDKVLYAKKYNRKNEYKVYRATPKQIVEDNFEQAEEFGSELEDAKFYTYDSNYNALLSFTIEDEDITFWLLREGSSKWKKYLTLDKDFEFTPVGFINDQTLAVLTNKDMNLISLAEFDIATQKIGKIIYQHPMYDLVDAEVKPQNKAGSWVRYIDHGIPKTHYFAAEYKKLNAKLQRAFKNQQISILDSSINKQVSLVRVYSSNNPDKYYHFDNATNKAIYLIPEYNNLTDYQLTKSVNIEVKVSDNINIEAILTKPEKNNNGVLLVYPHGGPIGVRDLGTYNPEVQYLASRGYSILNVNFRGSSGFGKDFLEVGKAQFGRLIEQDISAVVNQVQKKHQFKQMCSMGSSYGGYSAVMLAMYHPEKYQCVVSLFGIYDLLHLFNANNYRTLEENRKGIKEVVGDLDLSLKAVSPFYFAEKLNSPILLMAGKKDRTADFEQANRMKYRLLQLGKDIEYLFYDNTGHGHSDWLGDRHQAAIIDDFIRRKLNLELPITESSNKAIAQDMITIADGYYLEDKVKNDHKKALSFYQKAASLGQSRAIWQIANFHHDSKILPKNIDKALQWYQKSSNAGYAPASYDLADLYRKGLDVQQDFNLAFEYYKISKEQNSERADLALTRAYCLAQGTDKNFDRCISGLFNKTPPEKEHWSLITPWKKRLDKVLESILWQNNFNAKEKDIFIKRTKDVYNLDVIDLEIDDIEYGLFSEKTYKYVHEYTTLKIPAQKGVIFGAEIKLFTNDDSIEKSRRYRKSSMVKIKWIKPDHLKDPIETQTLVVFMKQSHNIFYHLTEDDELIAGNWSLEISSLDDKLLFQKTFQTY